MVHFDQWSLLSANEIACNGVCDAVGVSGTDAERFLYNAWSTEPSGESMAARPGGCSPGGGVPWNRARHCHNSSAGARFWGFRDQIEPALEQQESLLWLTLLVSVLIVGTAIPVFTLLHLMDADQDLPCVPGEGVTEAKYISVFKGVAGIVAFVKLPFLLRRWTQLATWLKGLRAWQRRVAPRGDKGLASELKRKRKPCSRQHCGSMVWHRLRGVHNHPLGL